MKGPVLAIVGATISFLAITAIFRTMQIRRPVTLMLSIFLSFLPIYIAVYVITPPNLGILPPTPTVPYRWFDPCFGLFIYSAAFFGGILQIYNLADRGLSLRMLIDIDESPRKSLTVDEMLTLYSRGRGLGWMYQKRLDGLLNQGLIVVCGEMVRNSAKGARIALIYNRLRAFLRFQPFN